MEKFEAVEALTTYQLAAEAAANNLKEGVWTARELGASWSEIGQTLNITKQAAQQKYGNRPDAAAPAPYEFKATNSKVTQRALVQAVLNGLDVRKEELEPLYAGAYDQIAVTIQHPQGWGWLYLVQTVGTNGKSSHGAYEAQTMGGKSRKITLHHFMGRIREWGNPTETTQAHTTKENTK